MKKTIVFFLLLCLCFSQISNAQQLWRLRCEMKQNPIGIGVQHPRLSWNINSAARNVKQLYYQVLVASRPTLLHAGKADCWNSGTVNAAASTEIAYQGKILESGKRYYWKLMVVTNKGKMVSSGTDYWEMSILKADDWKAKWIGYEQGFSWDSISQFSRLSARYFRKEIKLLKPLKKAVAHLVGLGLYELHVNGKKIGNQVLAPAPTDYRKNVMSNSLDVTAALKNGSNALGIILGNGRFFTMRQNYKPNKINNFGYPKLLFQLQLEYADGSTELLVSDETWKFTADGPIRTNNEYDGEEYDARKEFKGWDLPGFDASQWLKPELVKAPEGEIQAQLQAPMKVMKTLKPLQIKALKPGVWIMDMGQNFSGWIQFNVKGKAGETVQLSFAESLKQDGSLAVANLRDAKMTDRYTLKGGIVETWEPKFVYHGFRYVEISGYPGTPVAADFTGRVVFDDLASVGQFECSNPLLNQILKNAWWGIASNYKGMPVDCPQRNERQPWLGDRTVGSLGESYLFEHHNFYSKWTDDIAYAQNSDGMIPDVAPAFWNYYSDDITWPSTYIMQVEMLYRQYADRTVVTKQYPSMKKWIHYVASKHLKNGLIQKDKYGDWCEPTEDPKMIHTRDSTRMTEGGLLSTAYFYRVLDYMKGFADVSGNNADQQFYQSLQEQVRTAFNNRYYDSRKKQYSNNTVTANLLPLYFGMVPDSAKEDVYEQLYTRILDKDHGYITTGVIGTQWLMRGLTRLGRPDLSYTLATNTAFPSWGYMLKQGATTIWELWNGNTADPSMNSQNHVMLLGDLIAWYFEDVAGIRPDPNQPGFSRLLMRPLKVDSLSFVNASYISSYGKIKSEWSQTPQLFKWHVEIPANTEAELQIPADGFQWITEAGKPLEQVEGLKQIRMEGKFALIQIGSGSYDFVSRFQWKSGILKDEFIYMQAPFPEPHASTIVETPKGLLAAWFGGAYEGAKDVSIWTSRLEKGKWSAPQLAADGFINDSVRYACYNPVLYQQPGGELMLFYKIGPNVAGWTGWMKRSTDYGKTWGPAERLPDGILGPIKNKPIPLGGQLLCGSSLEKNGWKVHMEWTPDGGRTWTRSEDLNDGKTVSAIQPSLLHYKDGRLQILCRSRNRNIMEAWSNDLGKTWSEMKASNLPNNNSGTDAVTLKDGRQMLVYNHVKPPADAPGGKGDRTPLNVAISEDGIHWKAVLVLEDSKISQYSYPSVIQSSDGLIHIVYTWRRERIKYVCIDPAKLKGKEIVGEQWPN